MRKSRSRRVPTLTAPVLLRAQVVLATTQRAWRVPMGAGGSAAHAGGRSAANLRGIEIAAARIVSRIYRYASASLRAQVLACLLRPLGTLSLVAVASGAFATLVQRDSAVPSAIPVELAARYSGDQILELALFVHEVEPGALEQVTALLTGSAMGAAALSASALVLLYRRVRFVPAASTSVAANSAAGTAGSRVPGRR
jgi:hypothetical protein